MRWLLSTIATAMIFDDHDVHDDWNISTSWLEDWRAKPWWDERIRGAFSSYWIYQHIGNLEPSHLHDEDESTTRSARPTTPSRSCASSRSRPTARPRARAGASAATTAACGSWSSTRAPAASFPGARRDGRRRRVGVDLRAARRRARPPRHRHVAAGPARAGLHYLEAWNEATCAGAYGTRSARLGEKIRRAGDLEHWAAFRESFERLTSGSRRSRPGKHGEPPASIVLVSGDVHHAYLAEVAFRRDAGAKSAVYQAVCSPFRNPLDDRERRVVRFGDLTPRRRRRRARSPGRPASRTPSTSAGG